MASKHHYHSLVPTLLATYYYDADHQRTRKVTTAAAPQGVSTTYYHYDLQGHLIGESAATNTPLVTYIWNDGRLTGLIQHQPQRTVYTIETDQLGSPFQVRTLAGSVVWRWEPDAFGKTYPNEDPGHTGAKLTLNLRFPGQYYDQESGLHYNGHRYYAPRLARYLSPDPIGLVGGNNRYAYVNGNPLSYIDPLGLAQCTFDLTTGKIYCLSNDGSQSLVIPAASGNNGGGSDCKNNPDCTSQSGRGPIPEGAWQWTGGYTSKPNGRVLVPMKGTDWLNRTNIRSHSCANPFGPSKNAPFCSEGCVTSTSTDIKELNKLIDAEPGSLLFVTH